MEKIFTIVFICLVATAKSQTTDPSVLASAAGSGKISNILLEWTTGEFAVETISAGNKMYTQGFHQPYLVVTSTDVPTAVNNLDKISIAPNPVASILHLRIGSGVTNAVFISLADVQGKIFKEQKVNQGVSYFQLDLKGLPPGIYLLTVKEVASTFTIKTYKIIKL